MPKLTIDDIADLRAYERERDEFRRKVIALKRRRRVGVGDLVTVLFENALTIRFQIQEMARAEKLISDEAIETELRTYNPLVPERGQLCATLFVELTSPEQLREWLPKLVGIERSLVLRLADGEEVRALVDEDHDEMLTREEITASVHYVRWELTSDQVARAAVAPLHIVVDHPNYGHSVELSIDTQAEVLADLRHGG
jgi:hypothetical protein